ncbi:MAG: type II toxin-antitoxin system PemK/MazF family toxin [Verrucomicrobiales bacterium]|nr:type II toxin-antitoxin system PemK/MazF family toxin [Verrucomicrobiales bacterium]
MNAWEIWTFDPGYGDHPAVIVSAPNRVANKPLVEILLCSSQRAGRAPNAGEVLLDAADGLSWETLCKGDLIYSVDRDLLHTRRGTVTPERRRQIVRSILASHGWSSV